MTNRIFSDLFDTVKQKEKLNSKFDGKAKMLAEFYLDKLKIQALFLGKVIMTDAQFFDSIFLYSLSDEELYGFLKFAKENDYLEIRHRPEPIKKMLGKQFLFSSISEEPLANAIYEIGADITDKIKEDTAYSYFEAVEAAAGGRLDGLSEPYEIFKARLIKMDEWRLQPNQHLFIEWVNPNDYNHSGIYYRDLPDVIKNNRELWKNYINNKISLEPDIKKAVFEELDKPRPDRSKLSKLSDGSDNYKRFFNSFSHYYNIGIGSQHLSTTVESDLEDDYVIRAGNGRYLFNEKKEFDLVMLKAELDGIIHTNWNEFSKRYATDGLHKKRDELWDAVYSRNAGAFMQTLNKIREVLSFPDTVVSSLCESDSSIKSFGTSTNEALEKKYTCAQDLDKEKEAECILKFYI